MIFRDGVVNAHQTALENCETRFDRVGGDIAASVFTSRVHDRVMATPEFKAQAAIDVRLIRHKRSLAAHAFPDGVFDVPASDGAERATVNVAAARDGTEHSPFGGIFYPGCAPARFSADVSFIAFNDALQLFWCSTGLGGKSETNSVQHEKGRLVGDLALPHDFHRGHTLFRHRDAPERIAPVP